MSLTDPLIKELKSHATKLLSDSPKPITDQDKNVTSLCECIEKIFYKGLTVQRNIIGILRTPECWSWLELIGIGKLECPYSYISSVEKVKRSTKVTTHIGKVRLLIRTALVRRCIHVPVQTLTLSGRKNLYSKSSILGNEILSEVLLSVFLIFSKLEFKLDLENALFLDVSWQLPKAVALHLVPCSTLGLSIMFVEGKALIINVAEDSVAAENENLKVGDILDTLNGVVVNDSMQGSLVNVLRKGAGQPVSLYVVKGIKEGEMYPPVLPLLSQSGIETSWVLDQYKTDSKLLPTCDDADTKITFIGTIETGRKNDVKQIFVAINTLLSTKTLVNLDVLIECHDLGLKVVNANTKEVEFEHSYMEISSCGGSTNSPFYFAYIAGARIFNDCFIDSECVRTEYHEKAQFYNNGLCYINYANDRCCGCKEFKCYIFHSKNRSQIDTLLKTIGQGFRRTLFTV